MFVLHVLSETCEKCRNVSSCGNLWKLWKTSNAFLRVLFVANLYVDGQLSRTTMVESMFSIVCLSYMCSLKLAKNVET